MLANPEAVANPKLRQKIVDNAELLEKNIKLITLKTDVPDKPWNGVDSLARKTPDWDKIRNICEEMELKSLLRDLPGGNQEPDLFSQSAPPKKPKANKAKPESDKFAPDLFE